MRLLFIDETGFNTKKDYLGFCLVSVDATKYPMLKAKTRKILKGIDWDEDVEFKGHFLFSKTKGCTEVEVDKRVEAAHKILELNSGSNTRISFAYGVMKSTHQGDDYLSALPGLIAKMLPRAQKGAGKNLIAVSCDERSDVNIDDLNKAITAAVNLRGYVMLERVMQVRSSFDTVGLMFADLVGYLMCRLDTSDVERFQGLSPEELNGSSHFKKLKTSSELLDKIKKLEMYTHVSAT